MRNRKWRKGMTCFFTGARKRESWRVRAIDREIERVTESERKTDREKW